MEKFLGSLVLTVAGGMHAAYILVPPEYYIQMHGGDVWVARWVSLFAAPILFFFALLPWILAAGKAEEGGTS